MSDSDVSSAVNPDPDPDEQATPASDPVRAYLRKIGAVALLTREQEVAIAKRIEEGQRRILAAVLGNPTAVGEIVKLSARLKRGEISVHDIVSDLDEQSEDFDENEHAKRVCRHIDRIERRYR